MKKLKYLVVVVAAFALLSGFLVPVGARPAETPFTLELTMCPWTIPSGRFWLADGNLQIRDAEGVGEGNITIGSTFRDCTMWYIEDIPWITLDYDEATGIYTEKGNIHARMVITTDDGTFEIRYSCWIKGQYDPTISPDWDYEIIEFYGSGVGHGTGIFEGQKMKIYTIDVSILVNNLVEGWWIWGGTFEGVIKP